MGGAEESQGTHTLQALVQQCLADNSRWFPAMAGDPLHHALGVAGEAGEVANLMKKVHRGDQSLEDVDVCVQLTEELVDVLVYVFSLCGILDVDLEAAYDAKRTKNEQRFGRKAEQ